MSLNVPLKFGLPVPATPPAGTDHVIAYYGPSPMTPQYGQAARIDCGAISSLSTVKNSAGAEEYEVPVSLPAGLSGNYDFAFTYMVPMPDGSSGDETDFSPSITETVNTVIPPTPGQPVLL